MAFERGAACACSIVPGTHTIDFSYELTEGLDQRISSFCHNCTLGFVTFWLVAETTITAALYRTFTSARFLMVECHAKANSSFHFNYINIAKNYFRDNYSLALTVYTPWRIHMSPNLNRHKPNTVQGQVLWSARHSTRTRTHSCMAHNDMAHSGIDD